MKIHSLRLKNFRGFIDREFTFHDRLTLIIGENGSGKSSLLEGLAVALGGWMCNFKLLDAKDKRNIEEADCRIEIAKVNDSFMEQFPVIVECEASIGENKNITWLRTMEGTKGSTTTKGLKSIKKIATDYQERIYSGSDESLVLPLVAYYSIARRWNDLSKLDSVLKNDKIRLEGYRGAIAFSHSIIIVQ